MYWIRYSRVSVSASNSNPPFLADFVGIIVGFLDVQTIRLRSLLLAALLSFRPGAQLKGVQ